MAMAAEARGAAGLAGGELRPARRRGWPLAAEARKGMRRRGRAPQARLGGGEGRAWASRAWRGRRRSGPAPGQVARPGWAAVAADVVRLRPDTYGAADLGFLGFRERGSEISNGVGIYRHRGS